MKNVMRKFLDGARPKVLTDTRRTLQMKLHDIHSHGFTWCHMMSHDLTWFIACRQIFGDNCGGHMTYTKLTNQMCLTQN